jgi:hypothetical protein
MVFQTFCRYPKNLIFKGISNVYVKIEINFVCNTVTYDTYGEEIIINLDEKQFCYQTTFKF